MKIYRNLFAVAVVVVFVVPQVASAAWWNPLDWTLWDIFKPAPKVQLMQVETKEQATTTKITTTTDTEAKNTHTKSLKKQATGLTKETTQPKPAQPMVETPKTSTVTLPSGAVVEMDANGNIVRTVQEAPQPTYTAPAQPQQTYTPQNNYNARAQQEARALEEQQRVLEAKLAPLVAAFSSAIQNISTTCRGADRGQVVAQCQLAISKLAPIIQQERLIGILISIAESQRTAIQNEYYKLQDAYYQTALLGVDMALGQGIQRNIASQMQLLADAESLLY